MNDIDNVVFAFSVDNVVRLTGLTRNQLAYWDKLGFFPPQFASENRKSAYSRVYSFRDVVGLRTLSLLRNKYDVSFQRLRGFAEKLANYDSSLWATSQVYMLGREFYVGSSDGDYAADKDGQYAPVVFLKNVIGEITHGMHELRQRKPEQHGRIVRDRFVVRGAATIDGTRIPVAAIKRYHGAGFSTADIMREYPSLTEKDIEAALAYDEEADVRVA